MIAVRFNKVALLTCLLCVSSFAMEPTVLLSKLKFEKSLKKYENRISVCSKTDDIPISLDQLAPLKLTHDDWGTVLIHLSRKSFDNCVYTEKADFVMAVNSYISVSKHFNNDISDVDIYSADRFFNYVYSDLEYEIKYLELDIKVRDHLSKIDAFKHSFDAFRTIEAIEKSDLLIK